MVVLAGMGETIVDTVPWTLSWVIPFERQECHNSLKFCKKPAPKIVF